MSGAAKFKNNVKVSERHGAGEWATENVAMLDWLRASLAASGPVLRRCPCRCGLKDEAHKRGKTATLSTLRHDFDWHKRGWPDIITGNFSRG